MRSTPLTIVDPGQLEAADLDRLKEAAESATRTGVIHLDELPDAVRQQLHSALEALAHGETVCAVADGKPLTSSEAAAALGVSRTHLRRLCEEGAIASFLVGNAIRVPGDEIRRILIERARVTVEARAAAASVDERRRARAARAAGLI